MRLRQACDLGSQAAALGAECFQLCLSRCGQHRTGTDTGACTHSQKSSIGLFTMVIFSILMAQRQESSCTTLSRQVMHPLSPSASVTIRCRNSSTTSGLMKRRHLEELLGHILISVPCWEPEWSGCKRAGERQQCLKRKLAECGPSAAQSNAQGSR